MKLMKRSSPPVGPSFLVSQVGAHAARLFGEALAALDLRPHHAGVLRILGHAPGLSQQALSDLLGVFPSQLVRILDELERRRLVERRPNPSDRRSHRLGLTAAGERALSRIGALTLDLEARLLAPLSAEEIEQLGRLLGRIAGAHGLTPGVHPAYRDLGSPREEDGPMQQSLDVKPGRGAR